MLPISRLSADDFRNSVKNLADILADVVAGGSSLGFRAPFDQSAAVAWWQAQQPAVMAWAALSSPPLNEAPSNRG